jgi:hypothetical protein
MDAALIFLCTVSMEYNFNNGAVGGTSFKREMAANKS